MINSTYHWWSWGTVHLDFTILGPYLTTDDYTPENCHMIQNILGRKPHHHNKLGAAAALQQDGIDVNKQFDYQIYLEPECQVLPGGQRWFDHQPGRAEGGGKISIVKGPHRVNLFGRHSLFKRGGDDTFFYSFIASHEIGHLFGANHAGCRNDQHRGSVAWCAAVKATPSSQPSCPKASLACNTTAADFNEYCSPYSLMGELPDGTSKWMHSGFYIETKLSFGWANAEMNPSLVSSVKFDGATNSYSECNPSCTFSLQRSDAATLNTGKTVMILLETMLMSWAPSTTMSPWQYGATRRYFVMEHRQTSSHNSILLIHFTDIFLDIRENPVPPTGVYGYAEMPPITRIPTWVFGPTVLTDCSPKTSSWDDAGCTLNQSIKLDTGKEAKPKIVEVTVHPVLENDLLKVTLSPLPPPPPPADRRRRRRRRRSTHRRAQPGR